METKLDRYQKKVIKSKVKNLLVLAPAGSGKTLTIVEKTKKLINDGILPEEILCLSFTKEASKDLENKLLKEKIFINVKTFHSLGYEIIKNNKNISLVKAHVLEKIIDKHLRQYKGLKGLLNIKFIRLGYPDDIFNQLEDNIILFSPYKDKLKQTIITFINLYKSSNYKIKDFNDFLKINDSTNTYDKKKRHENFLKLVKKIIVKYTRYLIKTKQMDFNDMINLAIKLLDNTRLNYKYIIIDEYQDTSLNKINLIKKLQDKTNAKLMAVGDDWQSIYSFTGSNLNVITHFKKIFSKSKIITLKNTYRNSKELADISRKFICKNPNQIKKKVKSNKHIKYPIIIYYYKNNINEVWQDINNKISRDTLILFRNNKDELILPHNNLKCLTMHKAKGLESHDTVIINLENKLNSIPSKIVDSEYLTYVKPKVDEYKYAEERRLFYVALTRCKNTNYLIVKKDSPSIFIKEIIKYNKKNIKIIDNFYNRLDK